MEENLGARLVWKKKKKSQGTSAVWLTGKFSARKGSVCVTMFKESAGSVISIRGEVASGDSIGMCQSRAMHEGSFIHISH